MNLAYAIHRKSTKPLFLNLLLNYERRHFRVSNLSVLSSLSSPQNVNQDYFARKFEPAVSHEVVLKLDAHLYGEYLPDTPGLHSYWESMYHCEDQPSVPGDAAYTLYSSFKRHLKDYLDK